MAELDLDGLRSKLPPDSVVWRGDGTDWLLNLSELTQDVLLPDSSFVAPLAELLQSIVGLVGEINEQRAAATPPLAPIGFIQKTISTSSRGNPVHEFVIKIEERPTFSEVVNPAAA